MPKKFKVRRTADNASVNSPHANDIIEVHDVVVRVIGEHNINYQKMCKGELRHITLIGEVRRYIGHDGVGVVNPQDFFVDGDIPNGAYHCSVFSYPHNCIMYVWHRVVGGEEVPTGYIMDAMDVESLGFVEASYGWNVSLIHDAKIHIFD